MKRRRKKKNFNHIILFEPVDWVIPYQQEFVFNPFPSFNFERNPTAQVTVLSASGDGFLVGQERVLKYGQLTVNADNTLTYRPNAAGTGSMLRPETTVLVLSSDLLASILLERISFRQPRWSPLVVRPSQVRQLWLLLEFRHAGRG